jgi:hypothetical protein
MATDFSSPVGVSLLWPGSTLSRLQCVSCDFGTSQSKQVKCSNPSTNVQYFPVMILKNLPSLAGQNLFAVVITNEKGAGIINPLTPNDSYRGRTAPLTSKCCILYNYSTNIGTEYFKHGIYTPFFSLQNAVCFIILTYLVPVLFTFYIQGVLKLKK